MASESQLVPFTFPVTDVPTTESITSSIPEHSPAERRALIAEIKAELKRQDAVLVAHYYTDVDIQQLAEETGGYISDSLDMARFGNEHPATTLWWPGCVLWVRRRRFSTQKSVC